MLKLVDAATQHVDGEAQMLRGRTEASTPHNLKKYSDVIPIGRSRTGSGVLAFRRWNTPLRQQLHTILPRSA